MKANVDIIPELQGKFLGLSRLSFNHKLRWIPKNMNTITICEWVLTKNSSLSVTYQVHEYVHVKQWRMYFYIFFPVAYFFGCLVGLVRGNYYLKNPFEEMAYRKEQNYKTGE